MTLLRAIADGWHALLLTSILISRLEDVTNARSPASMLLTDPRDLGLAPDAVQERLRSQFRPDRLWYLPLQSGALEVLSGGFPEDDLVRKFWDMIADARRRGEPAGMHPPDVLSPRLRRSTG